MSRETDLPARLAEVRDEAAVVDKILDLLFLAAAGTGRQLRRYPGPRPPCPVRRSAPSAGRGHGAQGVKDHGHGPFKTCGVIRPGRIQFLFQAQKGLP